MAQVAVLPKGAVRLLTLESIIEQGLVNHLAASSLPTILTTLSAKLHRTHHEDITRLSKLPHIRFIPYYQALLHQMNKGGLSLLVGEATPQLKAQLNPQTTITIDEICTAFPEKVPLSYRNRSLAAEVRKSLGLRLNRQVTGEGMFPVDRILLLSSAIGMWDEAIQVIMDCQPAPLIIPYLHEPQQSFPYRLQTSDFLAGLRKIHNKVSSAVPTHPELNIIEYDQRKQFEFLLQAAPQTSQMTIDSSFFKTSPKIQSCGDSVVLASNLSELL